MQRLLKYNDFIPLIKEAACNEIESISGYSSVV